MSLSDLSKVELRINLFNLQDKVADHLREEPDIDIFIDKTSLFDEWEKVLPEAEYPIFVISVLNNIRKEAVIASIIDSIGRNEIQSENKDDISSVLGNDSVDHPFC